ncbi:MAG: 23S rRNA (uracil(1939)-C(5))-methyltransferase RlmD [Prevotellaceae bacterium]|jgi:23S rRNA (uracil1939-C5)-methyltransferase|nr:23S rRNA (uracil(1939)-C(5))-methyltransferase RlmD [Prevotellaceae bacterium]
MIKHQVFRNVKVIGMHSAGKAIVAYKARRIYVDNAIPCELVDIKVAKRQKGYVKGEVECVVKASENRANPFCKHFGQCGGCNWQHINYNYQLELKRLILQNALQKYDIACPSIPLPEASPQQLYYRNKTEYAFSVDNYGNELLGFHLPERSDCVLDIEECYLQPEPSRKIYNAAKQVARELGYSFYNYADNSGMLRSLTVRTATIGETGVIVGFAHCNYNDRVKYLTALQTAVPEINSLYYAIFDKPDLKYTDIPYIHFPKTATHLSEKTNNLLFKISPKAFYQPNPLQAKNLYRQVLEYGNFKGGEQVVDLYTGIGTIACYIAPKVGSVLGIEGSSEAIDDAQLNARINNIANAGFITGDILETFTRSFLEDFGKIDVIILDPPRSGTLIEIKKTILAATPSKIIYVSCNPVSLAFDLKQLCENHYQVTAIQPFDMFPHTHHVETVVLLERK